MTPAELYTLIQSDPQAKALFAAGNDTACATRCGVIAPPIRQKVPADQVPVSYTHLTLPTKA